MAMRRDENMMNGDVVCIAANPWDSLWRRRQHVMSRISNYSRVLYLEPSVFWVKLLARRKLFKEVKNNLYVFSQVNLLPLNRFRAIRHINDRINRLFIRIILQRLRFKNIILWVYYNQDYKDFIGAFGEKIICYDCYDKYVEFYTDRKAKQRAEEWEKRILSKADIVFAVSEMLCDDLRKHNQNVHFSPNGVDLELFSASNYGKGIHPKLLSIKKPILAYSGSFKSKVDLDLLAIVTEKLPECSLVLMGPMETDNDEWIKKFKQLTGRENVFYFGCMKREELPSCFNAVDVFLLPFSAVGMNYYSCPNKINEYFTSGKPVVAYDPYDKYSKMEVIRCGKTYEEVVFHIRDALLRPDNLAERRKKIAREYSWDNIVPEMLEKINMDPLRGIRS